MTNLHAGRLLTSARAGLALSAAVMLAAGCNLHFGTGVEARDAWSRTYTVKDGATLALRETNGRIRIVASDGDRIEVSATKVTKAPTEDAAKEMLKDFNISEVATADRVDIDGTPLGMNFSVGRSRWVEYEIKVPPSASVTIKSVNSEISVRGVAGVLRVDTVNGKISADGLGGGADVSSTNGVIELAFANVADAGIRCKTTNGEIVVTIPKDARATIAGRVVNGLIRTENLPVQASEDSFRRLDATIGGGGPEIRLETTNGEVRIVGK